VVLTARAVQGHAELAERRSELVSSVTHELKTPLATIRAVGDTLASGRAGNHETVRDYAGIVVEETRRLTRLVDTMLAYARITDVGSVYSFETISVDELIASTLKGFSNQLATGDFQVDVVIPPGLPPVRADRTSVGLLLDNVIDNAIRYSGAARRLDISARHTDRFVVVDISDHGIGITPDEIGLVTKKFFRGQRSGSGGSGLGLTIAHRIAADHGGSLTIASEVDVGTTVTVTLPTAIDQELGVRS
jgi:signal transduction histidine kinase